ncbi:unnamed protein product [Amoebophrya sp. A25]|nr:unnamed protein product [Amoebophrya sp. A25]|eukprot:GSA25T00019385001.1
MTSATSSFSTGRATTSKKMTASSSRVIQFRKDGRLRGELRPLNCEVTGDGSATVSLGGTTVLCRVFGPYESGSEQNRVFFQNVSGGGTSSYSVCSSGGGGGGNSLSMNGGGGLGGASRKVAVVPTSASGGGSISGTLSSSMKISNSTAGTCSSRESANWLSGVLNFEITVGRAGTGKLGADQVSQQRLQQHASHLSGVFAQALTGGDNHRLLGGGNKVLNIALHVVELDGSLFSALVNATTLAICDLGCLEFPRGLIAASSTGQLSAKEHLVRSTFSSSAPTSRKSFSSLKMRSIKRRRIGHDDDVEKATDEKEKQGKSPTTNRGISDVEQDKEKEEEEEDSSTSTGDEDEEDEDLAHSSQVEEDCSSSEQRMNLQEEDEETSTRSSTSLFDQHTVAVDLLDEEERHNSTATTVVTAGDGSMLLLQAGRVRDAHVLRTLVDSAVSSCQCVRTTLRQTLLDSNRKQFAQGEP